MGSREFGKPRRRAVTVQDVAPGVVSRCTATDLKVRLVQGPPVEVSSDEGEVDAEQPVEQQQVELRSREGEDGRAGGGRSLLGGPGAREAGAREAGTAY